MRSRRSVVRRLILLVGIAALALTYYVIHLRTSESLYTDRNTFAFWVTVSERIQEMPEVGPIQSPSRYFYTAGDGPKLQESAVSYTTSASPETIRAAVEAYVMSHGCRDQPPVESTFSYMCGGESIVWLEMRKEGGATRVMVRETR